MSRIAKKAVFLILTLGLVFNIERFDVGHESLVNMDSFIYVLVTLAAVLPFIVHLDGERGSLILLGIVLSLYFSDKILLGHGHPLLGGANTYISFSEIVSLSLVVAMAHSLAREIRVILRHSEMLPVPAVGTEFPTLDRKREEIDVEMARSRRHERKLGIVVAQIPAHVLTNAWVDAEGHLHPVVSAALHMRLMGNILKAGARRGDMVLEDGRHGRYILICPETEMEGLTRLMERKRADLRDALGVGVKVGCAGFPDDAVTFDDLLTIAGSRLGQMEAETGGASREVTGAGLGLHSAPVPVAATDRRSRKMLRVV